MSFPSLFSKSRYSASALEKFIEIADSPISDKELLSTKSLSIKYPSQDDSTTLEVVNAITVLVKCLKMVCLNIPDGKFLMVCT